jgi:hypothetical protein
VNKAPQLAHRMSARHQQLWVWKDKGFFFNCSGQYVSSFFFHTWA